MKKILEELNLTEAQARKILLGECVPKPKILTRYLSNRNVRFAIVSDTHLCSRYERLDELHTFYAICKKVGIKTVFHAGDILEGSGRIYRGQLNDIHTYGAMRQVKYVVENYPKVDGITTYYVLGNHDISFYSENGVDVGELISKEREDLVYLGHLQADFKLGKMVIRLLHPDSGAAYALSYKGQKIAEQIPSGQKPDVLVLGHYHTTVYFNYRVMHVFQAGAFQGQTPFILRKGINPNIGGWICEAKIGKGKDRVISLQSSFIPFF
jgi:predicted phosphodiesterase